MQTTPGPGRRLANTGIRSAVCAGAVVMIVAAVGCSDGGDGAPGDTAAPSAVGEPATPSTDRSAAAITPDTTGRAASSSTAGDPPSSGVVTVPDSGVPGLDSDDAFCRSWSEFAGSFQALALVSSFGFDPLVAARDELAASSVLLAAVAGLDDNLPDELESERTAFVVGFVGPMADRAAEAHDALVDAGLGRSDIDALGTVWLTTLADAGLDTPIEDLPVDAAVAGAVDQAAAAFSAARPPIVEDPVLITDAQVPRTLAYLAANCPDQGILAGSDG